MNTVEIKGREIHFIKRALNKQQHNDHFAMEALLIPEDRAQWSEGFIKDIAKKGLLRIENGKVYVTELAIRSVNEKDKKESRLIDEYIIDDFEYAFLMFMHNRDEPVELFDFPPNFKYHSKIDGQMVNGNPNLLNDWMSEIDMYITDPTIDGFVLNHTGKMRYAKLKKDIKLKEENEALDIEVKKQTIAGTKFSRNIAYASLFVAGLSAFITFGIWLIDKDKTQKTSTEIPQLRKLTQAQEKLQQTLQDVQRTLQSLDTSVNKIRIEK
jgi:hypothetical protein